MNKYEIRRRRLKEVLERSFDGNQRAMAEKLNRQPDYLSRLLSGIKNLGDAAREYEDLLGLPAGWLDDDSEFEQIAMPAGVFAGIPVVGSVRGGPDGYYAELEHSVGQGEGFIRYPTRDPNTYALRVKGDSMRPRIRPGEFIVVSPNSQPIVGDEAVIKTRDGRVMVKLYQAPRNGQIELHSINHDHKPITLETREIEYIHHVLIIAKADTYYPSMGL